MSDDGSRLNEAMQEAVQTAVATVYPGDMVTRFVVIVETLDGEDSDRALIISATPHMKAWDALGLLSYAVQREQAGMVSDNLESG